MRSPARFPPGAARCGRSPQRTARSLAGLLALLGLIPAGAFPREMTVIPRTNTLLVTDYLAGQVQAVNLATAP